MSLTPTAPASDPIGVVIVTHDSAACLDGCLDALRSAAPRRGVRIRVVDNASHDASLSLARARHEVDAVIALADNRGFAAGVNAGLASLDTRFRAVLNPDVRIAAGVLDAWADALDAEPGCGLLAPRVVDQHGVPEPSVGRFPTLASERAHALGLDRGLGLSGRHVTFPHPIGVVEWASGCAWLLRQEAIHAAGDLDEGYFMYFEDVDYCRRLHDAGWDVMATDAVAVVHATGQGSSATPRVAADGGRAPLRYFEKFGDAASARATRRWLRVGWRLRLLWREVRVALGHEPSRREAQRYRLALEATRQQ